MSTVSSIAPSSTYGSNSSATSSAGNPVVQTSDAGQLAQIAVSLSTDAGVIATFSGGASSSLTYDAAGLFNSLAQAGIAASSSQPDATGSGSQATQNSTYQNIVSTLPSDPASSAIYNSSGLLQGIPSSTTSNWAAALQANPSLAATVISDSVNQGIVGMLSTTA